MTTAFANHLKRTLGHLSPSTSYLTRNIGGSFCAVSQLTTTTFHHRQIHLSASVSFAVKSRRKQTPNLSKMFLFKPSTDNSDTYDPAKATSKYNAVKDAVWKSGEKVPFLALAKTFAAIEEHSGRLKSIEIMSNYFCSVMHLSPDDLVKSVYMCLNKVCPDYENIELGRHLFISCIHSIFLTSNHHRNRPGHPSQGTCRVDRQNAGPSEEGHCLTGRHWPLCGEKQIKSEAAGQTKAADCECRF